MGNDYELKSKLLFSCNNMSNSGSSSNKDAGAGYMKDSARSLFLAKWIERSKNNHTGKMHRIYTHHSGFMRNAANMKALIDYVYDDKIPIADIKSTHTYKLMKKLEDNEKPHPYFKSKDILSEYKNKKPFELDNAYVYRTHGWEGAEPVFLRRYTFNYKDTCIDYNGDNICDGNNNEEDNAFIKSIKTNFVMSNYNGCEILEQNVSISEYHGPNSVLGIPQLIPVEKGYDTSAKAVYRMGLYNIGCEPYPAWFLDRSRVCTALVNRAKDFSAMFDSSATELACDSNQAAKDNYCEEKWVYDRNKPNYVSSNDNNDDDDKGEKHLCVDETKTFELMKNDFYITYADEKIPVKSDTYQFTKGSQTYKYTIKQDEEFVELTMSNDIKNFIEVLISQQAELAYDPFTEDIKSNGYEDITNAYKSWANLSIISNKELSYKYNDISDMNECVVDSFTYEDEKGKYISLIKSCNLHDMTKANVYGDHTKNVVFNINHYTMQYPHRKNIEEKEEGKDETPVHTIVEENPNSVQTINPLYALFAKSLDEDDEDNEYYILFDDDFIERHPVSDNDRNAYEDFLKKLKLFNSSEGEALPKQLLNPYSLNLQGQLTVPMSYLFVTNTGTVRYKNNSQSENTSFKRSYMLFFDSHTFNSPKYNNSGIIAQGVLDPNDNKNMTAYTRYSNIETEMIFPDKEYTKFHNICSALRNIKVFIKETDPFNNVDDIKGYSKWFPIIQLVTPTRIESNGQSVMCVGTTGYPFKYKPQEWYGMQPELNCDTVVKAEEFDREVVIYTERHSRVEEITHAGIVDDTPQYDCVSRSEDIKQTFKFVKWRPFAKDGMLNVVFFPVKKGAKRVKFYNSLSKGKLVSCKYTYKYKDEESGKEINKDETIPIKEEYFFDKDGKYQDIKLDNLPNDCWDIQLIFEYTYDKNNTNDNDKIFNTITDQNIGEPASLDDKMYSYMKSTCSRNTSDSGPPFNTGSIEVNVKGGYPKSNGIKYYVYNSLDLSSQSTEILGCCNIVNGIAVKKTYSDVVDMLKNYNLTGKQDLAMGNSFSGDHHSLPNKNDFDEPFGMIEPSGSRYLSRYYEGMGEEERCRFYDKNFITYTDKDGIEKNTQEDLTYFMTYYNNVLNQVSGGGVHAYDIKREILEAGIERCLKKIDIDLLKYSLKFSEKQHYNSKESPYNIGIDTTPVSYNMYNENNEEVNVTRASNFSIRYRGFPFKEYLQHLEKRDGNVDTTRYADEYQGVNDWGGGWTDGSFLSRLMVKNGQGETDPVLPIINLAFGINIWVADKTDKSDDGEILVKNSWMTDGEKYYVFEFFKFFLHLKDPDFDKKTESNASFKVENIDASYYFTKTSWRIDMVQNLKFQSITWYNSAYDSESALPKSHLKDVQKDIENGEVGFKVKYSLPCENYKISWSGKTLTIRELKSNSRIEVVFASDNDYKMMFYAQAVLSHAKSKSGKWMHDTCYSDYTPYGSSSYNEGIFLPLNYGIFKKAPPMYKYQIIDRGIKFYTFMPSIWAESEPDVWAKIGYSILAVVVFVVSVVLTVVTVGAALPATGALTATAILAIVGGTLAVAGATVGLIATLGGIWGFIDPETLKILGWVSTGLSAVGAIFSAGAALNAAAGTLEIVTAAINLGASVANFGVMVANIAVEIAMEQEQKKLEKEQEIFKAELEVRLDALDNLNDYLFSTAAVLIPRDALNLFRVKRISEGVIETPTEFFNRTKNIDSQISYYKEFQFTTVENFVPMTLALY